MRTKRRESISLSLSLSRWRLIYKCTTWIRPFDSEVPSRTSVNFFIDCSTNKHEYVLYILDRKSQPACTRDRRVCQCVRIDARRTVLCTLRRCTGPNEVKWRKRGNRESIYVYVCAHETERPRWESNENWCKGVKRGTREERGKPKEEQRPERRE